jgi:Uma2 family endonuclease
MARSRQRATYEDLLRLPDHVVGELIDGELFATPRPASPHALASSVLGVDLGGPFGRQKGGSGGPGGWWILDEPELHFHGNVLVPDLAGWRHERMPRLPNTPAFELAPDWVCEIVSPSNQRLDRVQKMPVYAREKIAHLWLIDPLERLLETYRLEGGRWSVLGTYGGPDKVRAEPFDAIELDLGRLWIPEDGPPA